MTIRLFRAHLMPAACRKPALFQRACLEALGARSRRAGEVNLIFTTNPQIRAINRRFLSRDRATDVIAFPYPPARGPRGDVRAGDCARGERIRRRRGAGRRACLDEPFADVYVSVDRARRQAADLGHSLLEEILTLSVHGVLHVLGYDDHAPRDRRRMFTRQDRIVGGLLRPGKAPAA